MIRVLVIEDDTETAAEIVSELSGQGFAVDCVHDGIEGLNRARRAEHHVITLDRLLPGMAGLALLENLRSEGNQTPVLFVSALGDVDERVRGIRAGGDDYLVKPFVPQELSARVEALARRRWQGTSSFLQVGDLSLDLVTRAAARGGRRLDLAPRELRLLEFLMRRVGQTVTRAMLFEDVWNYRFDPGTNLVDVHMGRLRKKVDLPGMTPMIVTVRRAGFRLDAPAPCRLAPLQAG